MPASYSWTPPVTWVATDTPTYADMNDISENLRFLHTKDKVHVYDSADQGISNSAWALMTWDSEDYDSNSMHNNSSNTGRLTAKSDGAHYVEFKINFDTNTTGIRRAMLRKNSAASDSGGTHLGTWNEDGIASVNTTVHGGRLVVMDETDYVELFVYQDSGASLDVKAGANVSFFQMIQITG